MPISKRTLFAAMALLLLPAAVVAQCQYLIIGPVLKAFGEPDQTYDRGDILQANKLHSEGNRYAGELGLIAQQDNYDGMKPQKVYRWNKPSIRRITGEDGWLNFDLYITTIDDDGLIGRIHIAEGQCAGQEPLHLPSMLEGKFPASCILKEKP